MSLQTTLEAGAPGQFFERIMALPDAESAHPQFVNLHAAIEQAAESGNEHLVRWAEQMRSAIDATAEAEALQLSNPPAADGLMGEIGNIFSMIQNFFAALPEVLGNLRDGIQMDDFSPLLAAFTGAADPAAAATADISAQQAAAEAALQNAETHLRAAEAEGVDVTEYEGVRDDTEVVINRIEGITPG